MTPARYIMVGGFLGAGKTTALLRLAEMLKGRGKRVGLITNDQSTGLVDTTLARSRGVATEEITGGCFCCRFDSLTAAAKKLSDRERPDVFLAEPVRQLHRPRRHRRLPSAAHVRRPIYRRAV